MTEHIWRTGRHMPINVYEGDRPICQCHNEADAVRIVEAVNRMAEFKRIHDECHAQRNAAWTEIRSLRETMEILNNRGNGGYGEAGVDQA